MVETRCNPHIVEEEGMAEIKPEAKCSRLSSHITILFLDLILLDFLLFKFQIKDVEQTNLFALTKK